MDKYVSGRQRQLKVGLSSYSENSTVIQTIGKVGIGTTNAQNHSLFIVGSTNIEGDINVSGVSTFVGDGNFQNDLYVNKQLYVDEIDISNGIVVGEQITTKNLLVSGVSTFIGTSDFNSNLNVDGKAEIENIQVNNGFDVYADNSTFHENVIIQGNLTVNGDQVILNVGEKLIEDKQIVLGFSSTGGENDLTANGGGIAIASTEGYPLVDFNATGINTLPSEYKQLIWTSANTFGIGTTDAFLFNYAVGIGSTLVPDNVRLSVGSVHITDNQINAETLEFSRIVGYSATITGADISNLHVDKLYSQSGFVTDFSSTYSTFENLNVDNAFVSSGIITDLVNDRLVSGIATITDLDVTYSTFENLNVDNAFVSSGIITDLVNDRLISGIATITDLDVLSTATINTVDIENANIDDADFERIRVAGVSTFTNGPVLIGTGTSTGTLNQTLQVNGGVYISDNIGINTETPQNTLHIVGTVAVQGPNSPNRFYIEHNTVTDSLDFIFI